MTYLVPETSLIVGKAWHNKNGYLGESLARAILTAEFNFEQLLSAGHGIRHKEYEDQGNGPQSSRKLNLTEHKIKQIQP